MIQTYAHQKELHEARIDIKTLERLFANVITEGTNCSAFESDIIVEKAKEAGAKDEWLMPKGEGGEDDEAESPDVKSAKKE